MGDYDDRLESRFIASEQRTSQKERVCNDCGEAIHVGDRYYRTVGTVDGDFQVYLSHSPHGECGY